MTFDVAADAYDRFMGRYSVPLAPQFADFGGRRPGQRVLDVGCGPGALTAELVGRLGAACGRRRRSVASRSSPRRATRHPGVDVQRARPRHLPFPDDAFDAALAQLVVHFMADPVAGLARDGARDAPGRRRRGLRLGSRRRPGAAEPRSGRRRASSIPAPRTSRTSPARARATSRAVRGGGAPRVERRTSTSASSTRRSRSGGSRSRSASARRAPTPTRLDDAGAQPACAIAAASSWGCRPSP